MVTKAEAIKQELIDDTDVPDANLKDGLPMIHPYALDNIMSFTLRSLAPTGWEPEVTENDTLVFDSSRSFNDTPYVFALRKDTLTWYLLKTVVGPEGLVYFEDCQGKKHDQDSYIESLPVKGILRNVSRD